MSRKYRAYSIFRAALRRFAAVGAAIVLAVALSPAFSPVARAATQTETEPNDSMSPELMGNEIGNTLHGDSSRRLSCSASDPSQCVDDDYYRLDFTSYSSFKLKVTFSFSQVSGAPASKEIYRIRVLTHTGTVAKSWSVTNADHGGVVTTMDISGGQYYLHVQSGTGTEYTWSLDVDGIALSVPQVDPDVPQVGDTVKAWAFYQYPTAVKVSYQWLRDGEPISGATSSKYTVTAADVGSRLSLKVTGALTSGSSSYAKSLTSAETEAVDPRGCLRWFLRAPMASLTLGPDRVGDGRGEILAIDAEGFLVDFHGAPSSMACRLGRGFANSQVFGPGDLNSDGIVDILWLPTDGRLWLFPGDKDGLQGSRRIVGSGWTGWRLIPAGDLDGDGRPDLLGINSSGSLFMYAGRGDGTFATRKQVGSGWTGWNIHAAGDLNGDGKADILGINAKGELYQYLGKGNGNFNPRQQVGYGWTGFTLASGADLDGDGLADIVGRNDSTRVLYFYKGKDTGGFAARAQIATGW